eukprot:TRINITY_DN20147_c0_g1_i3.p1 TRINITY_DN20147_c0_g1~~TRINITY_DN20147_c0_g1_i3.p1  ORF type:complete len:294 (-),score=42.59 TRINITY_DN20147_c0_g1_i3:124-1005(-)
MPSPRPTYTEPPRKGTPEPKARYRSSSTTSSREAAPARRSSGTALGHIRAPARRQASTQTDPTLSKDCATQIENQEDETLMDPISELVPVPSVDFLEMQIVTSGTDTLTLVKRSNCVFRSVSPTPSSLSLPASTDEDMPLSVSPMPDPLISLRSGTPDYSSVSAPPSTSHSLGPDSLSPDHHGSAFLAEVAQLRRVNRDLQNEIATIDSMYKDELLVAGRRIALLQADKQHLQVNVDELRIEVDNTTQQYHQLLVELKNTQSKMETKLQAEASLRQSLEHRLLAVQAALNAQT